MNQSLKLSALYHLLNRIFFKLPTTNLHQQTQHQTNHNNHLPKTLKTKKPPFQLYRQINCKNHSTIHIDILLRQRHWLPKLIGCSCLRIHLRMAGRKSCVNVCLLWVAKNRLFKIFLMALINYMYHSGYCC